MTVDEFSAVVRAVFPVGEIIANPGGGTSTIKRYSSSAVTYVRKRSSMSVTFRDLHAAYRKFSGRTVSSSDLRKFKPSVFDSAARPAGHSCNCTFLFCVLERLNLSSQIVGSGVAGKPFAVTIHGGRAA